MLILRTFLPAVLVAWLPLIGAMAPSMAHEGHDHDKPPPLALPVAPRVVAVTPDFELVGVSSGSSRLTVFLHTFATNEPIRGARMHVGVGDQIVDAEPEGDGVFTVTAPWLENSKALDIVFTLTLSDGTQDLLTGMINQVEVQGAALTKVEAGWNLSELIGRQDLFLTAGAGLVAGILLTLLFAGGRGRPGPHNVSAENAPGPHAGKTVDGADITPLRRSAGGVVLLLAAALAWQTGQAQAADAATATLPSIPSTMATDLAQRMPDGSLFVPKATQHLLSIRTMLTVEGDAALSTELTGTIIAGPGHFGRVQPGRPGRIDAAPGGLAYVGKSVRKGELLAYVETYIEAADKANMDSLIAETEARIDKNRTILSRFEGSPGSVPQVRIDEIRGELQALTRKRAELLPSVARQEPVVAPIDGVVSHANATIGQIVEGRDVLFEIVDPSEFWVEAVAYGKQDASNPDKALAVTRGGEQIPLTFMGRGLALRQQATVLTFKMNGGGTRLAIGAPVKVVMQSTARIRGFVIPSSAIVRGQTGLPIVWLKSDAERFEPQVVKSAPLDGKAVVVTSGLKADDRVVTEGVTLLNQVR